MLEQILDVHGPMTLGCTVAFAQPDALKGSLVKTLRMIRPTVFFGVPRVSASIFLFFHWRTSVTPSFFLLLSF